MIDDYIREMVEERRELAQRLAFFDSNIWLGKPEGFPLANEITVKCLEDQLKKVFIKGGLVSHWRGKTISAQDGNRALLEAQSLLSGNFYSIWTGLPLYPTEPGPLPGMEPDPNLGKDKYTSQVRGVRLFPKSHNFQLVEWTIGSLCQWLIEHHIPLFIWHTEIDWSVLRQLALAFPELIIVIETQTRKILYHTRPLFILMRECPNIYLELSNFAGTGFIEYAVGEFGAERLFFGSFLPVSDPLVPMGMILDADISEKDKALIASGNLRRLIKRAKLS